MQSNNTQQQLQQQNLYQNTHNVFCCTICHEDFDTYKKQPKFLQCGHTFCKSCILQIIQHERPSLEGQRGNIEELVTEIKCPQRCYGSQRCAVKNLPTNFQVIPSLGQQNYAIKFDVNEIYCTKELHDQLKASHYCDICNNFLCQTCSANHYTECSSGLQHDHLNEQRDLAQTQNLRRNRKKETGPASINSNQSMGQLNNRGDYHQLRTAQEVARLLNRSLDSIHKDKRIQVEQLRSNIEALLQVKQTIKLCEKESEKAINEQFEDCLKMLKQARDSQLAKIKNQSNESLKIISIQHEKSNQLIQECKFKHDQALRKLERLTQGRLSDIMRERNIQTEIQEIKSCTKNDSVTPLGSHWLSQAKSSIAHLFTETTKNSMSLSYVKSILENDFKNPSLLNDSQFKNELSKIFENHNGDLEEQKDDATQVQVQPEMIVPRQAVSQQRQEDLKLNQQEQKQQQQKQKKQTAQNKRNAKQQRKTQKQNEKEIQRSTQVQNQNDLQQNNAQVQNRDQVKSPAKTNPVRTNQQSPVQGTQIMTRSQRIRMTNEDPNSSTFQSFEKPTRSKQQKRKQQPQQVAEVDSQMRVDSTCVESLQGQMESTNIQGQNFASMTNDQALQSPFYSSESPQVLPILNPDTSSFEDFNSNNNNEDQQMDCPQERLIDPAKEARTNQQLEEEKELIMGSTQATLVRIDDQQMQLLQRTSPHVQTRAALRNSSDQKIFRKPKGIQTNQHVQNQRGQPQQLPQPINLSRQIVTTDMVSTDSKLIQTQIEGGQITTLASGAQSQQNLAQNPQSIRQFLSEIEEEKQPNIANSSAQSYRYVSPLRIPAQISSDVSPIRLNFNEEAQENQALSRFGQEGPARNIHFLLHENKVLRFNPETQEWSLLQWKKETGDLSSEVKKTNSSNSYIQPNTATCSFPDCPNKMLLTGGPGSNQVMTLTYDLSTNEVIIKTMKESMIKNRQNHQLVFCNNYFYAIGGQCGNEVLNQVERLKFDPDPAVFEKQKWEPVKRMNTQRSQFAAVTANYSKDIIVLGGSSSNNFYTNTIEIYFSELDEWKLFSGSGPQFLLPMGYSSVSCLFIDRIGDDLERFLILGTQGDNQNNKAVTEVIEMRVEISNSHMIRNLNILRTPRNWPQTLKEKRTVKGNVFVIDNKVLIIGGNQSNNGEYMDLLNPVGGFKTIKSYKQFSQNPLTTVPVGTFQALPSQTEENEKYTQ